MSEMFRGANFMGDISKWDVSNVMNMEGMFRDSSFQTKYKLGPKTPNSTSLFYLPILGYGDISKWDVSNVRNMRDMFRGSKFKGDISKWDVSSVRDIRGMFSSAIFNGDISKWDTNDMI